MCTLCQGGELKLTDESVLPVTGKEGKGKGKGSIGPRTCVNFALKQTVGFVFAGPFFILWPMLRIPFPFSSFPVTVPRQ